MLRNIVGDLTEQCYECSDGSEALAAYTAHHPDWLLMDISMKEMDGLAATRQIIANYPEARIVIVTNYDDSDLRAEARAAGACAYVLKEDLSGLRHLICQ